MAKDGSARGGRRVGSGKKPTKSSKKDVKNNGILDHIGDLPTPEEIEAADVPDVRSYLKSKQKNGKPLCAEEIFKETYAWLKKRGCEKLVSIQLIEQYAMSVARFIQCEEAISEYGFLSKHPTTGNAIASPFVIMSQSYMKQINATWYSIYSIVKDNGADGSGELDESDITMAKLLSAKNY